MMLKKKIQNAFDPVRPTGEQKEAMLRNILEKAENAEKKSAKKPVCHARPTRSRPLEVLAAAAALALVVGSAAWIGWDRSADMAKNDSAGVTDGGPVARSAAHEDMALMAAPAEAGLAAKSAGEPEAQAADDRTDFDGLEPENPEGENRNSADVTEYVEAVPDSPVLEKEAVGAETENFSNVEMVDYAPYNTLLQEYVQTSDSLPGPLDQAVNAALCYAEIDLDGDGVLELVIAWNDENQTIAALYTMLNGKPMSLLLQEEGVACSLREGGAVLAFREPDEYVIYRLENYELNLQGSLRRTAAVDSGEEVWQLRYPGGESENVTGEEAREILLDKYPAMSLDLTVIGG